MTAVLLVLRRLAGEDNMAPDTYPKQGVASEVREMLISEGCLQCLYHIHPSIHPSSSITSFRLLRSVGMAP